jgi:hypothetical protein
MIHINMTRINPLRNIAAPRDCVAWGKNIQTTIRNVSTSPLVFAAVLIVCSLAVGCSREKPKPVSSNNQIPTTQMPAPLTPMPASTMQAESKPAAKKVVHRKPATVNYTDKTHGVSFEYPRRYAIETGDAATDLLASSPLPMNFVAPGGVALAAVELPETGFANTDFSSAFFNVSVHQALTADQCNEFAVPEPKVVTPPVVEANSNQSAVTGASTQSALTQSASSADAQSATPQSASSPATAPADQTAASLDSKDVASPVSSAPSAEPQGSKLMLGDLELLGTEAVSGEGTRQSDSKYFHVFQNGACYEFALNVTTVASQDGMIKHVDRDKVFNRLEKILSTVKINAVTPEATAETPATPTAAATPAQ